MIGILDMLLKERARKIKEQKKLENGVTNKEISQSNK